MHIPDHENDPWDTATPAEIRQDLIDYAQPPADTWPTPAVGLFQFLPSTFQWPEAAREFATSAREAGLAATDAASSFADMARADMRAQRRDTLHREAAAALARGDRKAHRRALSELRDLERKH